MLDVAVGEGGNGAVDKVVIAAQGQDYVLAAVGDQQVAGRDAGVDAQQSCIVRIVDDGFVQPNLVPDVAGSVTTIPW